MEIQVAGSKKSKITLSDEVFACAFNEALIHQVVTAVLSGARAGTHAQKTRSEVRGGGIKPWKQKGTGRARAGTIRSPIWRKGGRTFAAKTQDYSQKINKKMYQGAMRSILSELFRQDRFTVLDTFNLDKPNTKALLKELDNLKLKEKLTKGILIVTDELNLNLSLSARNVPKLNTSEVNTIDPVCLVNASHVIITSGALKQFEEMLK